MNNPNVLVSLAYIKTSDNPLQVFCNYILYLVLTSPNKSLRIDELKSQLCEHFGLKMPFQMLNMCTRVLTKSKELCPLPHGAGYSAGKTCFNISSFENEIRRLQEQEIIVLSSLINFVKEKYSQNWTEDNAKQYLSHFLETEGNAARLFLRQEIPDDVKKVSPSWYIGRYISSSQSKKDSLEWTYLEDIVKGMMIYVGINQTNDYQQDKNQKFKGTTFFFDTKLVLRLLGYSWTAQVDSTRELYELITKEYGGIICIFPQTLTEIKNAMDKAGKSFQRSGASAIGDSEIRLYAQLNSTGASLLSDAAIVVEDRLKKEFNITLSQQIDWDEDNRYNIAIEEIVSFICSKHPAWRKGTVQYDVEIINQVNILRRGDYSIKFGSAKKLPVFITSNADLVYTFRDYVEEATSHDANSHWNVHSLPVISDMMILFRLWLPHAKQYNGLPSVTLARFAYAAQNPNTQYFEKLRATALSYEEQEGISLLNLNETRRQKLEDILIANSQGNAEELTVEVMATSVGELVALENIDLQTKVSEYEDRVEEQNTLLSEKDSQIVALLAKPFLGKNRVGQVLVYLSQKWWIFAAILLLVCRYFAGKIIEGVSFSSSVLSWIITLAPIIIEIIFVVIDKAVDRLHPQDFLVKFVVYRMWHRCVEKISQSTPAEHKILEEQVIEKCKSENPIFSKYSGYCTFKKVI